MQLGYCLLSIKDRNPTENEKREKWESKGERRLNALSVGDIESSKLLILHRIEMVAMFCVWPTTVVHLFVK